jgi:hypothetical protein
MLVMLDSSCSENVSPEAISAEICDVIDTLREAQSMLLSGDSVEGLSPEDAETIRALDFTKLSMRLVSDVSGHLMLEVV